MDLPKSISEFINERIKFVETFKDISTDANNTLDRLHRLRSMLLEIDKAPLIKKQFKEGVTIELVKCQNAASEDLCSKYSIIKYNAHDIFECMSKLLTEVKNL